MHAPMFFTSVQEHNGVTVDTLIDSLDADKNRDMVFRAGEGAGASGSFFFFSYDRKFIIKTMSNGELKVFLKMLPEYEQHLTVNRKSLFSRVYGIYTIYMNKVSSVNLILMANTLRFKNNDSVTHIFDLKGSTISRFVKPEDAPKPTSVLKDTNFLEIIEKQSGLVKFMPGDAKELREIIKEDCAFSCRNNIMDYSLLFAIEKFDRSSIVAEESAENFAINEDEQAFGLNPPIRSRTTSFFEGHALITPKSKEKITDRKSLNSYLKSKGMGGRENKFGRH